MNKEILWDAAVASLFFPTQPITPFAASAAAAASASAVAASAAAASAVAASAAAASAAAASAVAAVFVAAAASDEPVLASEPRGTVGSCKKGTRKNHASTCILTAQKSRLDPNTFDIKETLKIHCDSSFLCPMLHCHNFNLVL